MAYFWKYVLVLIITYAFLENFTHFFPESIENKCVLITGASSGLGEQLAYRYATLGAKLVLTGRHTDRLQEVVTKCKKLGAKQVTGVAGDMTIAADRKRVLDTAQKFLGGLNQLILNHASFRSGSWNGTDQDLKMLNQDLDVNFLSFVDLASKAIPLLAKNMGNIGVVSSMATKVPQKHFAVYAATKSALEGFFTSLRQDLRASGIKVSVTMCVVGLIDTDSAVQLTEATYPEVTKPLVAAGQASEAAQAIIAAVINRMYTVYYPWWTTRFFVHLHQMVPTTVEDNFGYILSKLNYLLSFNFLARAP